MPTEYGDKRQTEGPRPADDGGGTGGGAPDLSKAEIDPNGDAARIGRQERETTDVTGTVSREQQEVGARVKALEEKYGKLPELPDGPLGGADDTGARPEPQKDLTKDARESPDAGDVGGKAPEVTALETAFAEKHGEPPRLPEGFDLSTTGDKADQVRNAFKAENPDIRAPDEPDPERVARLAPDLKEKPPGSD